MRNPYGFQFYPGKRLPAVCRDGVTRSAVLTGYASGVIPAMVQVTAGGKRRTVSGFVYNSGTLLKVCYPDRQEFAFEGNGRNSDLIGWTAHKPRLAAVALRLIKATAYGRGAPGYIWDFPADHSAAIAGGCRLWYGCGEWPQGGFAARAVLRRLPHELLPRLAAYFDKLGRFQSTPPPPPPA